MFLPSLIPLLVLWFPYIFLASGFGRLKNAGILLALVSLPGIFIFTAVREELPAFISSRLKDFIASGPSNFIFPEHLFSFLGNGLRDTLAPLASFYFAVALGSLVLILLGVFLPKLQKRSYNPGQRYK